MQTINKKFVFGMSLLQLFLAGSAIAGNGGVSGGDPCQSRIEEIRNNIDDWITAASLSTPQEAVGSAQLDFSSSSTDLETYNTKMQLIIDLTRKDGQTSISCTNNPREVMVRGAEKTCVAIRKHNHPKILCYRGQPQGNGAYAGGFLGASQDDQYFQIHHELAVLAGFEDVDGQESNYPLSSQISAKLESQVIKKLPILPKRKHAPMFHKLCIGERIFLDYGRFSIRARIDGLLANGDVMIDAEPDYSGYGQWSTDKIARTYGCARENSFCVGERIITDSGMPGTIDGIYPNGDVVIDGQPDWDGFGRWSINHLALTSGCVENCAH